jgi:hypothetical protein
LPRGTRDQTEILLSLHAAVVSMIDAMHQLQACVTRLDRRVDKLVAQSERRKKRPRKPARAA